MDSVQSIGQFFKKLADNYKTTAETRDENSDVLEQILGLEVDEKKDREKKRRDAERTAQRAKRNKKRKDADRPNTLQRIFGKKAESKEKGINWLLVLLGGGALLAIAGKMITDFISNWIDDRVEDIKKSIDNWWKEVTGQVEKGADKEVKQAAIAEAEAANAGPERASQPPASADQADEIAAGLETEESAREMNPPQPGIVGEPGGPTQVTNREEIQEQRIIETEVLETDDPQGHEEDITAQKEQKQQDEKDRKEEDRKDGNNNLLSIGANVLTYGKTLMEGLGGIGSDLLSGKGITMDETSSDDSESPEQQQQPASSGQDAPISGNMQTKGVQIAKRLQQDMNISAAAASGIVGNLMLESGLQPDNVENGKGFSDGAINNIPVGTQRVGYGYGQWTNDRLEKFRKWLSDRGKADKPATDEDNYQYLLHELRGAEPLRNHWKSGTSIPENDPVAAANWFMMNWERPGKPHADRRQSYARQIYDSMEKRQKGGAVGKALAHIKKDEALSSLTKGSNDWVRPGGASVLSKTPWDQIKADTKLHAYRDSVGVPTIGWGNTYYDSIRNGKKPVKMGDTITKSRADQVMHDNVRALATDYSTEIPNWGKMSDSQQAGLISMGYNAPNFYSSNSFAPKLRGALQKGDMKTAANNLSWGGPSPTRISESQAMLRNGPMDLSKASAKPEPKKKEGGGFFSGVKKFLGLQSGGAVVPGSGTGDQYPVDLPAGSFVLNKNASSALQSLSQGTSAVGERFTAANDVHSKHFKKKGRPVVIVNIPEPAPQMPSPPPSPKQIESPSSGGLNISKIRSTMNRVNAGAAF